MSSVDRTVIATVWVLRPAPRIEKLALALPGKRISTDVDEWVMDAREHFVGRNVVARARKWAEQFPTEAMVTVDAYDIHPHVNPNSPGRRVCHLHRGAWQWPSSTATAPA